MPYVKKNLKQESAPCLHCEERVPGCHGKCEKYAKWLEPISRAREARARAAEANYYEIHRLTSEKEKKRKKHGKDRNLR